MAACFTSRSICSPTSATALAAPARVAGRRRAARRRREQVQAVVRLCHREGMPFVARGHGTGLSGGALPVAGGVVIALGAAQPRARRRHPESARHRRAGRHQPGDHARVAPYGYYYAPDPSSQQVCSIGGNVAENSGGAHCLKYGFTVHHVLALDFVLPDGEHRARRQCRWSTRPGPDLLGLIVGSEGTLGDRDEGRRADPAAAGERADAARRLRQHRRRRAARCRTSSPRASCRRRSR